MKFSGYLETTFRRGGVDGFGMRMLASLRQTAGPQLAVSTGRAFDMVRPSEAMVFAAFAEQEG